MGFYSKLPLRCQLRGPLLLVALAVGFGAPRVGLATDTPPKKVSEDLANRFEKLLQESKSNTGSGTHGIRNTDPRNQKDQEKEQKDQEKGEEKQVPGVTVNGQPLYETKMPDGTTQRYYYVNGDKTSPFISAEQKDGSFKWSTKNAMLGKTGTGPGGLTELGMIETSNGKLGVMYQTPDGGRAFSDGSKWFSSPSGQNSFTQSDVLTAGTDMKVKVPKPFRAYDPPNMTSVKPNQKISEIGNIFERVPREISPSQGYTETFKNPSVPSINGGGGNAVFNDGGMVCNGGSCALRTTAPSSAPRWDCSGRTCRLIQ